MTETRVDVNNAVSVIHVSNPISNIQVLVNQDNTTQNQSVINIETLNPVVNVSNKQTAVELTGVTVFNIGSSKPIEKQAIITPFSSIIIDALPINTIYSALWQIVLKNNTTNKIRQSFISANYNGIDVDYVEYGITHYINTKTKAELNNNKISLIIQNLSADIIQVSTLLISSMTL